MNGYTLIETLVIISILSILATLILTAWPAVRTRQALLLAQQQVQSLIRKAQEKAWHEERTDNCKGLFPQGSSEQSRCSDIGVAFRGQEMVLFADTFGTDKQYSTNDFILEQHTIVRGAQSTETNWHSFLFTATPPRITLFDAGRVVTSAAPGTITISAGQYQELLNILPYGQVQPPN